jgi:UDP-N-acetylmuramoyl-tripeptide--D-alanyl-D-alanine ligase
MNTISLLEIQRATGAVYGGSGELLVNGVCTDTRAMRPGSLFIALRGEKFDAHTFISQAANEGAAAALVDQSTVDLPLIDLPLGFPILRVADTRRAMGDLAKYVRQILDGTVIAVAGSNGKTSTKHLIQAALQGDLQGTISPKSFNNDIGVPITIFAADPSDDYLVLEIGTNHPGEILSLGGIAQPDIAVITNCTAEHLEGLGSVAGVRRENASIIERLDPRGLLVVNGDDLELLDAVSGFSGRRVTFGFSPSNDLFASDIQCGPDGTRFSLNRNGLQFFVPLLGEHSACNALAALAVGRAMGLEWESMARNIRLAVVPEMRLQLQNFSGVMVLNDAYNANPASMKAALLTFAAMPARGRKIAVLGDMREMGTHSPELHRQMGSFVGREILPDLLICVGTEARIIAQAAVDAGLPAARVRHFANSDSAGILAAEISSGDLVLLKASRFIKLERVAKAIAARSKSEAA